MAAPNKTPPMNPDQSAPATMPPPANQTAPSVASSDEERSERSLYASPFQSNLKVTSADANRLSSSPAKRWKERSQAKKIKRDQPRLDFYTNSRQRSSIFVADRRRSSNLLRTPMPRSPSRSRSVQSNQALNSSYDHAPNRRDHTWNFVLNVLENPTSKHVIYPYVDANHKKRIHIETIQYRTFDMTNLPYIVTLRRVMLVLCMMTVCVAPFVYLPLGELQKLYHPPLCFLNSSMFIRKPNESQTKTVEELTAEEEEDAANALGFYHKDDAAKGLGFYPIESTCGHDSLCQFATFQAVSVSIFAVIIGWSTLQIWPELMSVGHGGALALVYIMVAVPALLVSVVGGRYIQWGVNAACDNLCLVDSVHQHISDDEGIGQWTKKFNCSHKINCSEITRELRYILPENKGRKWTLEFILNVVLLACWMLAGLLLFMLLVSLAVFWIIYWYYHRLQQMFQTKKLKKKHKNFHARFGRSSQNLLKRAPRRPSRTSIQTLQYKPMPRPSMTASLLVNSGLTPAEREKYICRLMEREKDMERERETSITPSG